MSTNTSHYSLVKPGYDDERDIGVINSNMDTIDTTLYGKKNTQSAVSDPSASGTSVTFIKSISQNTQGVITPAKATVSTMGGATSSAAGSIGLVPQPASADRTKFLKGDGTWATPSDTTYSEATSSAYGLIKIGYSASGKNYPVQLSSGKAYVNVPWTDTDTNTWRPIALNGETKLSEDGGTTLNIVPGTNMSITHSTGGRFTFSPDLSSCVKTSGTQTLSGVVKFTNTTASTSTSSGAVRISGGLGVAGSIYGNKVYNAVWNDYAECREVETLEAGRCVTETESGVMALTEGRLQAGCRITSDTFGACMGETATARTPIAVAGRVLAYPFRDRNAYHLGDALCSAPGGTVDVMTREEVREYPERMIGTVSEIPKYDVWMGGTQENPQPVEVNGRIWVYVR